MVKRTGALTVFGRDLDSLLKQAGISSLREYADACGVNYKYISQLRTSPERRPGGLYVDLLKPFARLNILDVTESHRLSSRHRGKHLSFTECHELFPDLSEQEILESVKQAGELIDKMGTSLHELEVGERGATDTGQVSSRRELLYRNIFVGRQTELSALTDTFDAAVAGQGSLVMIAGEPGIGKTAICEQLSTYIISRGGKTLWGHCYEEGSLSLPYLAFIEALSNRARNTLFLVCSGTLGSFLGVLVPMLPVIVISLFLSAVDIISIRKNTVEDIVGKTEYESLIMKLAFSNKDWGIGIGDLTCYSMIVANTSISYGAPAGGLSLLLILIGSFFSLLLTIKMIRIPGLPISTVLGLIPSILLTLGS